MKNQYPFYTLCLALTMLTACSGEKKRVLLKKEWKPCCPTRKTRCLS